MPTLDIYFQALSQLMASESRLLASVFRTHRGKLGENREALLHRFFSTYLPARFGVGTGFALLGSEEISSQQDIVIYDSLSNPVLFPESVAPLFPPSALVAVVEVKSRLTKAELRKTVAKSIALKRAIRASFERHPAPPQRETLSCLFAFEATLPLPRVLEELAQNEESLATEPIDRLDMICVLGQGLVFGSAVFHSISVDGEVLTPHSTPTPQHWLALETRHELFTFYSRVLDHIMAMPTIRPQLMSYVPADMEIGRTVAAR